MEEGRLYVTLNPQYKRSSQAQRRNAGTMEGHAQIWVHSGGAVEVSQSGINSRK